MSRIYDLNNKYRVLLTEVLPYEIPLMLDNWGFYRNMQDEEMRKVFCSDFEYNEKKEKKWTIPFDYCVRKYGGDKSRKLSIMHPITQLDCVEFYNANDSYMLSLCRNSPFSIRYIANRAQCIFKAEDEVEDDEATETKRVEVIDNEIEKRYRSYFRYKRYDMMYKFFNSGDYLRLEQKYSHLLTMDIASCFYHIYTHTISWAIKGKEEAKELVNKATFENNFDRLMQHTNYNETNGIIVGPEISRIFAEIILQRIDINVLNRLKQGTRPLRLGRDYEVRRYVDDHYIYAHSEEVLRVILDIYRKEFENYKLYVNESKLEFHTRPFASDVSDAKREINDLVTSISKRWLEKGENDTYKLTLKNEMKVFTELVNRFRKITHTYNLKYGILNRYFLSLLSLQVSRDSRAKHATNASAGLLLMYVELAFYIFSLDMNVSASLKICRILDNLHKWADKCDDKTILPELENRIYRETKRCLDIYGMTTKDAETNIEVLNLLLSLSRMMKTQIQREQMMKFFGITDGDSSKYEQLNYFQICTLLYVIGDEREYDVVRSDILVEIKRRLDKESIKKYAEAAMLFLDAIVCPFFKKNERKDILKIALDINNENKAYEKLKIYSKTGQWFFCWDKTHDLSEFLSKKEYHSPYE